MSALVASRSPLSSFLLPRQDHTLILKKDRCQNPTASHLPPKNAHQTIKQAKGSIKSIASPSKPWHASVGPVGSGAGLRKRSSLSCVDQAHDWSPKRHVIRAATQAPETDTDSANADVAVIEDVALAERALGGPAVLESPAPVEVETKEWLWEGHKIRYQQAGQSGPAVLCIHGFGANCDHWRKNLPVLGQSHRVFAIDLLGYGFSDKPDPRGAPPNSLYTFDTWARQALAFLDEIVGEPASLVCNSVGGNVGLVAALAAPSQIRSLLLLNISLRQLHVKKQQWFAKPFVKALQTTLRTTDIGRMFFASVAKPEAVKRILQQCYHDKAAVTEELVEAILQPGLLPGAVDVFLDFICYSGGPLPEEMLPLVKCPVVIGWGEEDPWEPIALGRAYGEIPTVEEFVVLPGVGHCPQDEAPHLVNPLIERFVAKYHQ